MLTLSNDIRHGIRLLAKTPALTFVALAALALGTGANTAMFSVVRTVLLQPLAFPEPDRLIRIYEDSPQPGEDTYFASPGMVHDLRHARSVEHAAGYWRHEMNLSDDGGEPERLRGVACGRDLLDVLEVKPMLGRGFIVDDYRDGQWYQLILSWPLWQRRYAGDPAVLGRKVVADGRPYTIVGVMPPGVRFANDAELWEPLGDNGTNHVPRYQDIIARLKSDVPVEQARAEMTTIAAAVARDNPKTNAGWNVVVREMKDDLVGDTRPALIVLLAAVAALLLIACANVASLLLAQAETRQREIAIRAALGASGRRIARQLLTESTLLSLLGGAFGVAIASWSIAALKIFGPQSVPRLDEVRLDLPVLGFTTAISIGSGLLFGLAPAIRAWRPDLGPALGEGRTATAGREHQRLRRLLVIGEVAVAVILVVGAGLLVQSFSRLTRTSPGFAPHNVLTFNVALPYAKYENSPDVIAFYDRLLERLKQSPAVVAAATTTALPLKEELDYRLPFSIVGLPSEDPNNPTEAWYRMVSADYLRALGVPLKAGRFFTNADGPDGPAVVVVNESFVRKYMNGLDPLGRLLDAVSGGFGPLGRILLKRPQIVGIVGDVKHAGLASEGDPAIYFPARQAPFRNTTVLLRTHDAPSYIINEARAQLAAVDPALPFAHVATLEENLSKAVARPRFQTLLLGAFAALALLLGAIGLYGILAYAVVRRRREIGIRLALGGAASDIRRMIVGEGIRLVVAGVGVGLAVALLVTRYLETLLFGVSARDPLTFSIVPVVLGITAGLASYVPVRRATHIDPVTALRE